MPTEFVILSPRQQVFDIQQINSQVGFEAHYQKYMPDDPTDHFLTWLRKELSQSSNKSGEYFKFLGLVTLLAAQYGYSSLDRQINAYLNFQRRYSFASPEAQLALASYLGRLNEQSIPIKEDWSKILAKSSKKVSEGVWGLMLESPGGVVQEKVRMSVGNLLNDVLERRKLNAPICLPMQELNQSLGGLGLTLEIANSLSPEEFKGRYLEETQKILKGVVDFSKVLN